MDYALGMMVPFAFWCAVVTAVAVIPAVIALLAGRWRLGGWLIAATALPVLFFLGVMFTEVLQFAQRYGPGEPPRGVMWSMAAIVPTGWCAFMLLVGGVLVASTALRDRARRHPA